MDSVVDAQTLALSLAVVTLVAAARKHAPRLDGPLVLAVALVLSVALVFSADMSAPLPHLLTRTVIVFGCAVGGNAWAMKVASAAAPEAISGDSVVIVKGQTPVPEPPEPEIRPL